VAAATDVVIRRYRDADQAAVEAFKCVTPGQRNWTKPSQDVIRCAPVVISEGEDATLVVAEEESSDRIVGVIVFGPDSESA
jgi:hypothetical protein